MGGTGTSMQRVAVVGAGGFVGGHLVRSLNARGMQVAGISLEPPAVNGACAEWLACDLQQDRERLADFLARFRPDSVILLAATSFEPLAASQPWRVIQNNLLSALNTFTACRTLANQPVIVITSSSAVYGRQRHDACPLTESHSPSPLTTYGVSKLAVEALALQQWRAFGLRNLIVRPFNVTGPGEHASFVTSAFARQIALIEAGRQDPVLRVGDLQTVRDFTDVRDVASALAGLAERGQPGEVYNLCSGTAVKIEELARRLLRATPVAIDLQGDPALMRPVEIDVQWGDSTKLRRTTGWAPRYGLDQTLADVLNDWRIRIHRLEA
jgi:GDP-4-dehydro-6-deoxy-D-mannose reductase